jgi:hypothetical protein
MMATRKPRRFNEGDLVSDKEAGLKASKGEKVGFFERLRMGNIDDEKSEAYKRFGAGRGKMERTPVEDAVAVPVERKSAKEPAPTTKASDLGEIRDESGTVSKLRRNTDTGELYDPTGSSASSSASTRSATKPAASKKSTPTKLSPSSMTGAQPTTKTYDRSGGPTAKELSEYRRSANNQSASSQIPGNTGADRTKPVVGEKVEPMSDAERNLINILAATGAASGAGAIYRGKKMLDARKAAQQGAAKRAMLKRDVEEGIDRNLASEFQDLASSAGKTAEQVARESKTMNPMSWMAGPKGMADNFKRGGKVKAKAPVKKMASGGSTSGASKRGDGIAQRGHTRGKIY